ncbi:hypothetical protein MFIFM68171_01680 [Madurella fahalii]|uniref:Uncharacterized protein n=1 Tax=Madurella fahalii TaxID=1157608 RepID=A0ABQ0G134_9PEZI
MNSTLEQLFQDFAGHETWLRKCASAVYEAAKGDDLDVVVAGLVGKDGAVGVVDPGRDWRREDIWGINIALCNRYCSRERFPMVFNYEIFVARTTNYLLPWLALTAQLPYEAGDIIPNIMSFFMAVGSPMLLAFSLMMTIFNRRWIRRKRKRFNSNFPGSQLASRVGDATVLLEAAQQAPLRMSYKRGWLASLVLLGSNRDWWERLSARLLATKRKMTLALVAQLLVAVTAWILTTVGSFGSQLGDHAEALAFSSSALWTWLVSIICGWVIVGTQGHADDVGEALRADAAYRAPAAAGKPLVCRKQEGFRVADGDDPGVRDFNFAGFGIHGDEIKSGPVYNYARMYTWRHMAQQVFDIFEVAADKLYQQQGLDGNPAATAGNGGLTLEALQADPIFDSTRLAAYCGLAGLGDRELAICPRSDEVGADFRWQVFGATLTAAFVQWGSTGAAIIIAYLTDTKGLGCRSGSYLLYGTASTVAFLCFVLSVVCSRQALLRVQYRRFSFNLFRGLSVVLRLLGRVLVLGNSAWLVVTSLFELVGFFDNCWCEGVVFAKGEAAVVVLFKNAVDLAENARPPWAGGVALSGGAMLLSTVWFALLCRKPG